MQADRLALASQPALPARAKILARAASLRSSASGSFSSTSSLYTPRCRSSSLGTSASAAAAPVSAFVTDEQRQRLRERRALRCRRRPNSSSSSGCTTSTSRVVSAMASGSSSSPSGKTKIIVTGAGGRTGKLAVEYLLARPEAFEAVAVARAEGALKAFADKGAATAAVDVTADGAEEALAAAFAGADAVIIATSAVPKIQKRSLVRIALAKLFRRGAGLRPTFTWKGGNEKGAPVEVDWLGQKRQIDAAVKAGVKRVVIVSSMGVTQPENFLNTIGPGERGGRILLYKRKAEEYLFDLAEKGKIEACVVHPGGLIDQPGGQREIVVGVDDTLLKGTVRSIPRADVAALSVACATLPEAKNVSLDAVARSPEDSKKGATTDFAALLRTLGGRTAKYIELPAEARV